jgi:hypothetical protein
MFETRNDRKKAFALYQVKVIKKETKMAYKKDKKKNEKKSNSISIQARFL